MKKLLFLFLMFIPIIAFSQSNDDIKRHTLKHVNLGKVQGYLEFLPADYHQTNKQYPLLIFLHGNGQKGNGGTELYKLLAHSTPPHLIEMNPTEDMCFEVNGVTECFIVISPQLTDYNVNGKESWGAWIMDGVLKHIMKNYRVDPNKVYLTGYSLGAIGVYKYAPSPVNEPNKLAAVAPVAGFDLSSENGCIVSDRKINVWAFHGEQDSVISFEGGLKAFNAIKDCTNPVPTADLKFTAYPGVTHFGVTKRAYATDHTYHSPNLYEWFLSHSLNEDSNQTPTANAGPDVTVNLPQTEATLNGSGSDADGSIVSYSWAKVSGPSVSMAGTSSPTLSLSNLVEGVYQFSLTVVDNEGATATDNALVTVKAASGTVTEKYLASKNMHYLEYLPQGYSTTTGAYPVLIYLHSDAAEGNNLNLIKQEGPLYYITQQNENYCFTVNGQQECFIVIAPQVGVNDGFYRGKINALYNEVISAYNSDPNRIYITGFGGGGTDLYMRLMDPENKPNRYAGAAFVGASTIATSNADTIGNLNPNIWVGHGDADAESAYSDAQSFYTKIKNANATGDMLFVTYEGANHTQSGHLAYKPESSLYPWLLNHTLNGNTNRSAGAFSSNNFFNEGGLSKNAQTKVVNFIVDKAGSSANLNLKEANSIKIQLVNYLGQKILVGDIDSNSLDLGGLAKGMYLYKIVNPIDNTLVQYGRILKIE